jgi:hypothetical protein
MTTQPAPTCTLHRSARLLSDWIDPKNVIIAVSLLIGCGLYGWKGLGTAVAGTVYAALQ